MKRAVSLGMLVLAPAAAERGIAQSAPASALQHLAGQLEQRTPLVVTGTAHDNETGADWTFEQSTQQSHFTVDPGTCRFRFHWKAVTNGKVITDTDIAIPLATVDTIMVLPVEQVWKRIDAGVDNPTRSYRATPAVSVLSFIRQDGTRNELNFSDPGLAARVAQQLTSLIEPCGGRQLFPAGRETKPPALDPTLRFIESKLNQQGLLSFAGYLHDDVSGKDSVLRQSTQQSQVRIDPGTCRLSFHWSARSEDQKPTDVDTWLLLGEVEGVQVLPLEKVWQSIAVRDGNTARSYRMDSSISVLRLERADGYHNEFNFYEQEEAARTARAMEHAVELCGGGDQIFGTEARMQQANPTLEATLAFMTRKLNQQGTVNYAAYVHDEAQSKDWIVRQSTQIGQVDADPARCTLSFHWKTTSEGATHTNEDVSIGLSGVADVDVLPVEKVWQRIEGVASRHYRAEPAVSVLSLIRTDGSHNEFTFYNAELAQRVKLASQRAIDMCGGGTRLASRTKHTPVPASGTPAPSLASTGIESLQSQPAPAAEPVKPTPPPAAAPPPAPPVRVAAAPAVREPAQETLVARSEVATPPPPPAPRRPASGTPNAAAELTLAAVTPPPARPATRPAPAPSSKAWVPTKRLALVIGNSTYGPAPGGEHIWPDLQQEAHMDADAVAQRLKELNFDVILIKDQDLGQMNDALEQMAGRITPDTLALFYFAGHGAQVPGARGAGEEDYLIPARSDMVWDNQARFKALSLTRVTSLLRQARASVVILDACRSNALRRSKQEVDKGLGGAWKASKMLIAYSAASGEVSDNRPRQLSLYTEALVKTLGRPGESLSASFGSLRRQMTLRPGARPPEVQNSLNDEIVLVQPNASAP